MRSLILVLLSFAALTSFAGYTGSGRVPLRLSIVPEESADRDSWVSSSRPFYVVAINQSDAPVTVWREWCSWGYFALSLDLKFEDGTISRLTKKSRGWDRNFPDPYVIRAGASFVLVVRLKEEWSGYPTKSQKVSMRARYTSKPDLDFGSHKQVWLGEITSPWIEVTFDGR